MSRPARPISDNLRGIGWMMGAIVALTSMFVFMKLALADLPLFVAAELRNVFALVCIVPFVIRLGGIGALRTTRPGAHFVRAFFGNFAFVCLNYAIMHLILADAMTLSFTTPLWSILTSALILGDRIRASRVIATLIGFVGVLFIVKPSGDIEPAALIALLSALSTSLAMIGVKKLSGTEPPTRVSFYFIALGAVLMAPPAIATWQTPDAWALLWLFIAGLLTVLGQECLVRAYGYGEVTIIAPMDYLRLPFAGVTGFLVFAEMPDLWSVFGTVVIVGTSVYIARVEGRRPPASAGKAT